MSDFDATTLNNEGKTYTSVEVAYKAALVHQADGIQQPTHTQQYAAVNMVNMAGITWRGW